MFISEIEIENFRLLKSSKLSLDKETSKSLTLLLGRNNSGKTSFISLFEKFLTNKKFDFNDFSLALNMKNKVKRRDFNPFINSIRLYITIEYDMNDDLSNIADFITDLDENKNTIDLLLECRVNKEKLWKDLEHIEDKGTYTVKNINEFLEKSLYIYESKKDVSNRGRDNLIEVDIFRLKDVINFQVIHAKRDVASSEASASGKKTLSNLTTKYYKDDNRETFNKFNDINKTITAMDKKLNTFYDNAFSGFLEKSKDFLRLDKLKVVSNLESQELISHHSKIIYGEDDNFLPEHLNGLGYMNILYLLLEIEMKSQAFLNDKKDINLLYIEEPEAHTHPQMQYIFIDKISEVLLKIDSLQTIITTHSSHIVSKCDFKDIRYLCNKSKHHNVEFKDFNKELKARYDKEVDSIVNDLDRNNFNFIKQYLTISSSELFFAEKIIFIEGVTERILLPYFINKYEKNNKSDLSSQNITIIEVGANSKAFRHFIEFLDIKALVITDIDTTFKKNIKGARWEAIEVENGRNTSNESIKYFFNAPKNKSRTQQKKDEWEANIAEWTENIKTNSIKEVTDNVKVAYQSKENGYHGRSFEDAFISINLDNIIKYKDQIIGINKQVLNGCNDKVDYYELTGKLIESKSNFASSLLYLALSQENVEWNIPKYITDGFKWIEQ